MWFKLAGATFSINLGPMSKLSSSISIKYNANGFNYITGSVSKDATSASLILTLNNNYTYEHNNNNVTVTGATKGATSYSNGTLTIPITPSSGSTFGDSGVSSINVTVIGAVSSEPTPPSGGDTKYTITYQYMCNGSSIKTATTEQVIAGTSMTFSTSNAPAITGYTVSSVSPTSATITGNTTVTYTYTANAVNPPASGSALDLSTLSLAHCGSAKLGDGDKENLIYNQTTHELKVHSTGWYKVSYFEQPVTVGTEIEYIANYGKTQTGNFVGLYVQNDLVDGVTEEKSSFWPTPSKFGVYAPGQGGNDYIYIWDKKNAKTKTSDGLEGDYFNGKTIKLKLLATGTEIYVDGVKLTWASGAAPATLAEGENYYLGFHNNASTSVPVDTGLAQTITYIGPIR